MRLSQAENVKRIKPLYLSFERQSAEIIERIRSLVPTAVIGRIDAGWRDALREKLLHDGESAKRAWNRVYLIDPIGNLVLSYAIDADPAKMRKDLSRLLRASQIG
ncbi:MAG: hypothetical protein DWQ08_04420 [Proteobacteria bacterium]|nr:MAG: hypothetical protein DWQ08_04420 [Pseudomonadota bacterium]